MNGMAPSPLVEGFSTLSEASHRVVTLRIEEAERLSDKGRFRHAADALKRALAAPYLSKATSVDLHARRAKAFRQFAESKKTAKVATEAAEGASGAGIAHDAEEDPLRGLAAEWAIQEAEEALLQDPSCYLAAWEGAIAAKHTGWWSKGRALAKSAMDAVPPGPEHRAQRETAGMLFMLMSEEEQAEKVKKARELQQQSQERRRQDEDNAVDKNEFEWATITAAQLNEALKAEDFRRPHHQLWKLIGPGLRQKDSDAIFGDIRELVWQKWDPLARQCGYHTAWDIDARRRLCARIVDVVNTGKAQKAKELVREIEDRVCLGWPDIPEQVHRPAHDETWAWTRREDGSWGAWGGGIAA